MWKLNVNKNAGAQSAWLAQSEEGATLDLGVVILGAKIT